MYKVIRKYQKKLLAIFAVLLMIAFVATLGPGGPGGRGARADVVVGHVGKTALYDREFQAARDHWRILMGIPIRTQQSFGQDMPLPEVVLPYSVVKDIEKHPELFLLLRKEAEQRGVAVSMDEAKTIWVNQLNRPIDTVTLPEIQAIQGILTIRAEYQQLADAVKVSQPIWRREAAHDFQGVRLNLVDFRAEEFDKSVPAPTSQQLQEQFDKYKNTPPRESAGIGADSLGFGYQIPTRVKLQYFQIPHALVVASLQPTPEIRHDWEVKAADYYLSHQDEFRNAATQPAATEPATTQSTAATTAPAASQPVAASQPAIKPFDQVKAEIVEKLLEPDVAKQTALVEKELTSQLAADWIAIRKSNPAATQPAATQGAASQPATSQPASAEMNLAHLEQIRADIQKKMHIDLDIHEINDWRDAKELAALPGIGTAQSNDRDGFSEYALNFSGQPVVATAVPLQVWEPSQPLADAAQNAFVFRLTAAEPAHAPPDMTPLSVQVTRDWRVAQAYELARQAATKLAESAKSTGLPQASRAAGLTMLATGQFSPRNPHNIPGYPLNDAAAQQDLGQGAGKLLEQATPADAHPSIMVELPTVQRVVVAELAAAQLELPEWFAQSEIVNSQRQMSLQKLGQEWFAYDAVVDRMNYTAEPKAGS